MTALRRDREVNDARRVLLDKLEDHVNWANRWGATALWHEIKRFINAERRRCS